MGTGNKIPRTCKCIGCSYKLKNVNPGQLGKNKEEDGKEKKKPGLELQEDRGRQGERLSAIQSNPEREAGGKRDLSANGCENPGPDYSLDRYRNVSHHKQQRERSRQTPRSHVLTFSALMYSVEGPGPRSCTLHAFGSGTAHDTHDKRAERRRD